MTRRIWKYTLDICDTQEIAVRRDAEILTAQVQDGKIALWAMVNPDMPCEMVRIHIIGTGNPVPAVPLWFIATVQSAPFVWHVFREV